MQGSPTPAGKKSPVCYHCQNLFEYIIFHPLPSQGYIDGDEGIMLVKTASLRLLLQKLKEDMTSYDLNEMFWEKDGNIYALLPEDCFIRVTWDELPGYRYSRS